MNAPADGDTSNRRPLGPTGRKRKPPSEEGGVKKPSHYTKRPKLLDCSGIADPAAPEAGSAIPSLLLQVQPL